MRLIGFRAPCRIRLDLDRTSGEIRRVPSKAFEKRRLSCPRIETYLTAVLSPTVLPSLAKSVVPVGSNDSIVEFRAIQVSNIIRCRLARIIPSQNRVREAALGRIRLEKRF